MKASRTTGGSCQDTRAGMNRREMLRWLGLASAGAALAACTPAPSPAAPARGKIENSPAAGQPDAAEPVQNETKTVQATAKSEESSGLPAAEKQAPTAASAGSGAYMTIVHGEDPAAITEAALKAMGGIERFVKPGFEVILKPNICTAYYSFEYAATTNPQLLAALVKLALGAGAKRVRVMDYPFGGTAQSAYAKSGIAEAVKAAGGEMTIMNSNKYKKTKIPDGKSIQEWDIYQDVLNCDLLINVPIAKHHSLAGVTAGLKNLMGVVEGRYGIHADLDQRVADLASLVRPQLTVLDAVRTLMRNGPTGGDLNDVKMNNMVVVSQDIVAVDTYAVGLLDRKPEEIGYIRAAADLGLGTMDLKSIKIEELTV